MRAKVFFKALLYIPRCVMSFSDNVDTSNVLVKQKVLRRRKNVPLPYSHAEFADEPTKKLSDSDMEHIECMCGEVTRTDPRKEIKTYYDHVGRPFPGMVFSDKDDLKNSLLARMYLRVKGRRKTHMTDEELEEEMAELSEIWEDTSSRFGSRTSRVGLPDGTRSEGDKLPLPAADDQVDTEPAVEGEDASLVTKDDEENEDIILYVPVLEPVEQPAKKDSESKPKYSLLMKNKEPKKKLQAATMRARNKWKDKKGKLTKDKSNKAFALAAVVAEAQAKSKASTNEQAIKPKSPETGHSKPLAGSAKSLPEVRSSGIQSSPSTSRDFISDKKLAIGNIRDTTASGSSTSDMGDTSDEVLQVKSLPVVSEQKQRRASKKTKPFVITREEKRSSELLSYLTDAYNVNSTSTESHLRRLTLAKRMSLSDRDSDVYERRGSRRSSAMLPTSYDARRSSGLLPYIHSSHGPDRLSHQTFPNTFADSDDHQRRLLTDTESSEHRHKEIVRDLSRRRSSQLDSSAIKALAEIKSQVVERKSSLLDSPTPSDRFKIFYESRTPSQPSWSAQLDTSKKTSQSNTAPITIVSAAPIPKSNPKSAEVGSRRKTTTAAAATKKQSHPFKDHFTDKNLSGSTATVKKSAGTPGASAPRVGEPTSTHGIIQSKSKVEAEVSVSDARKSRHVSFQADKLL